MLMSWLPMGEQPEPESPNTGAGTAWSFVGILVSGMLAWGGIGWLVDHWLGTSFLFPVGLIVGSAAGMYLAIKRTQ